MWFEEELVGAAPDLEDGVLALLLPPLVPHGHGVHGPDHCRTRLIPLAPKIVPLTKSGVARSLRS